MKKYVKAASAFLLATFVWLGSIPIQAQAPQSIASAELTVEERNLLEELTELDPTHDDINGEIVSVKKTIITKEEIESRIDESIFLNKNGQIQPYGNIGSTYMTMYTTITRLSDPGFDKYSLYVYFKWDTLPLFQLTDGIALAWSDSFTLLSSSMTLYYEGNIISSGYHNDRAYLRGTTPEAGVGYAFPLHQYGSQRSYYDELRWGSLRAYVRKYDSTGTANLVAKYVHTTLGLGSPSFSFSAGGPSISVSVSGGYDSREVYNNWTY